VTTWLIDKSALVRLAASLDAVTYSARITGALPDAKSDWQRQNGEFST
jgi:hypothetical protein